MKKICCLALLTVSFQFAMAAGFRIGLAKTKITPEPPFWMTGFAARTVPASGVLHDLWAKAMVIDDGTGHRMAIITTDLLGLPRQISDGAAKQLFDKYGLKRNEIMFNSSHTHSGPMVWPGLSMIADYSYDDQKKVSAYADTLINRLTSVVARALAGMAEMQLSVAHTDAAFAFNRRIVTAKGVQHAVNKDGLTDHDVPVLKVTAPDGTVKGILFGYACHNTTIQANNTLFNGDYAGFAQIALEKKYPEAVAMFVLGCAGDQNPAPRGTIALAQQYGEMLAAQVGKVVDGQMKQLKPSVRSSFSTLNLEFKPYAIEKYQKDILTGDAYLQRRAKLVLEAVNRGWDIRHYTYPVQAINFGDSFYLVALGGETVVDYSLKLKQMLKGKDVFVAGYSNEVVCYIPSERVLKEGGYEADDNLIYYGMAGPFKPGLEKQITNRVVADIKKIAPAAKK